MTTKTYEAVVLGGGPAGYVCAIRLGQLGVRTACIEEASYGGVCLNWGCIPSKALISTAHHYTKLKEGAFPGVVSTEPRIDVAAMQTWKSGIVDKLTGGVRRLLDTATIALSQVPPRPHGHSNFLKTLLYPGGIASSESPPRPLVESGW